MDDIFERQFRGVWIPKEVYLDKNLSWSEKILFAEIDSLDGDTGCYATNQYFASFLNIKSEETISRMISHLKALGHVFQETFNGRKRILKSCYKGTCLDVQVKADLTKKSRQTCQKSQGRLDKKVKSRARVNLLENNNINNTPLYPPTGDGDCLFGYDVELYLNVNLQKPLLGFVRMREDIGSALTSKSDIEILVKRLKGLAQTEKEMISILEQSIFNKWKDIYPLDEKKKKGQDGVYVIKYD